jgi:hypothetical protein
MITAELDIVLRPEMADGMQAWVPNLRRTHLIKDCGHWTRQEKPDEVNEVLLDFLADLGAGAPVSRCAGRQPSGRLPRWFLGAPAHRRTRSTAPQIAAAAATWLPTSWYIVSRRWRASTGLET